MAGSKAAAAAAAAGKKRKNNTANSDFKRIKAKVGKKAIKINETDVSFKSASLRVNTAGQQSSLATPSSATVADDNNDNIDVMKILISSRGKKVDELIIQLGHPAAAVRKSALKGIQDIVKKNTTNTKTTTSSSVLLPYLSIVIPSCIHTCVDEDEDVRRVGIDVVVALLQPHTPKQIRPFGPLIMARIGSALHSLDPPTRQDGVRLCHQITSKFPSLIRGGGSGSSSTTSSSASYQRLLPSFTHLLSDPQTNKTLDETLLALVSILRAASSSTQTVSSTTPESSSSSSSQFHLDTPDLIYKSGDRSQNSVILLGRRPCGQQRRGAPVRCYESLSHLPIIEDEGWNSKVVEDEGLQGEVQNATETNAKNGQHDIQSNLLEKLRDVLLESMNADDETDALDKQQQRKNSSSKKKSKPSGLSDSRRIHLERSVVVLRAVRLLCRLNLLDMENKVIGLKSNNAVGCVGLESVFEASAQHILSLSMDRFPVTDDGVDVRGGDATDGNASMVTSNRNRLEDEVNAAIVATLLDVSFTGSNTHVTLPRHKTMPQDKKRNEGWLKKALMYILPRISSSLAADLNSSSTDLETTCKLARRLSQHNIFPSALLKILQSIQESVFSSEEDSEVARSVVGRKLYLLMMELAEDDPNLPLSVTGSPKSEILAKIVLMAPFYLGVWKDHFLYESHSVLCKLKAIIQRMYKSEDSPVIDELRKRFFWLVKQKKTDDGPKSAKLLSVLESYPLPLQKRTLGLIVLLQSSQEDCLVGLSGICSRNWGKSSLVLTDGIVDAVHSIRTTVSMKSYLIFLIGSIGLSNQIKDLKRKISKSGLSPTNFDQIFNPIDSSLKSISAILVKCGPSRILPMVLPQLMSWLNCSRSEKAESDHQSLSTLIKKRAAIVIFAYLSLATHTADPEMSLPIDISKLIESLCSFVHMTVSNPILSNVQYKMVLPLVGLMASNDCLLAAFLEKICVFQNIGLHRNKLMDILTLLQHWVSDQRLYHSITRNSTNSQVLLKSFQGILDTPAVSKDHDINSKTKQLIAAVELC